MFKPMLSRKFAFKLRQGPSIFHRGWSKPPVEMHLKETCKSARKSTASVGQQIRRRRRSTSKDLWSSEGSARPVILAQSQSPTSAMRSMLYLGELQHWPHWPGRCLRRYSASGARTHGPPRRDCTSSQQTNPEPELRASALAHSSFSTQHSHAQPRATRACQRSRPAPAPGRLRAFLASRALGPWGADPRSSLGLKGWQCIRQECQVPSNNGHDGKSLTSSACGISAGF